MILGSFSISKKRGRHEGGPNEILSNKDVKRSNLANPLLQGPPKWRTTGPSIPAVTFYLHSDYERGELLE